MPRKLTWLGATLTFSLCVTACGKGGAANSDSTASVSMSPAAATQPPLSDTAAAAKQAAPRAPETKRPRERAPETKAPAAPARPTGEIASGATLLLHPTQVVCTDSNKVGDIVTATVADAVTGTNGVSIPAGAVVRLRITALKRAENVKDPIDMGFDPQSVEVDGQSYDLHATVVSEKIDHIRNEPKSKDVQKVVGGAVIGAIAGKLIGKSTKGAVVGAAAGAAAGAGVAATTANFEGCIAKGSDMTVKLTAPVTIK